MEREREREYLKKKKKNIEVCKNKEIQLFTYGCLDPS